MLNLAGVVRLDSAFLIKELRPNLTASYPAVHPISLPLTMPVKDLDVALKWLLPRRFNIGRLQLQPKCASMNTLLVENVAALKGGLTYRSFNSTSVFANPEFVPPELLSKIDEVVICILTVPRNVPPTQVLRLPFRTLKSFYWQETLADNQCLVLVLQDNPQLEEFRVYRQVRLPAGFLPALCMRGATLRTLQLGCDELTDSDLCEISLHCTRLTTFEVSVRTYPGYRTYVTDVGVTAVTTSCAMLETIHFIGLSLPPATLAAVLLRCIHLRECNFWVVPLQDAAVHALCNPSRIKRLEKLYCTWDVTSALDADCLKQAFCALTQLTLFNVTEGGMDSICSALRVMPRLQQLSISAQFAQYQPSPALTSALPVAVLEALAQGSTRLSKLHIGIPVAGEAESSLVALAQRNVSLTELDISSVRIGVTDAVVSALAEHCANLAILRLNSATLVTDTSVVAPAHGCTKLNGLKLSSCTSLTDRSVLALATHCPLLSFLDVSASARIRQSALEQVIHSCKKLRALNVSSASMAASAVERLQREMMHAHARITRAPMSTLEWVAAKAANTAAALWH
jgi:hypothetical protein